MATPLDVRNAVHSTNMQIRFRTQAEKISERENRRAKLRSAGVRPVLTRAELAATVKDH